MVVLVDAHLRGGDATQAAIVNEAGYLHLRDVVSSGYRCAVLDRGHDVAGSKQAEYVSDPSVGLFDNRGTGLHLPVRETPSALDPDFSHWTSVTTHGAIPDDGQDDTQAIQSALDSGATTICLPGGTWHIKDTLVMRGAARWLLCGNAILLPTKDHRFADRSALHPVLRIAHTDVGGEVYIERVESRMHEAGGEGSVFIKHASPRTLVVRASQPCAGLAPYRSMLGCGDLFLEDVATHSHNRSSWRFDFPQHIWARQLNVELNDHEAGSNIRNRGATLWILGLKTEDGHVVIDTSAGGSTEVLGACLYPAGRVPPPGTAAFISTDSRVSLSWFFCGSPGGPYPTWVREVRNGVTRELTTAGLPDGRDRALPLYCGWAK